MNKLKSKLGLFATTTICLLLVVQSVIYAGSVSEEARRHMARGQAAVEMAKSPDEYDSAINEFQQASRLAPDWPDPYYQLAKLQEKTGKLKEAVVSLKTYLRLAPNASDVTKIQEQIYKLEYKAEQMLTVPEIIDVLVSFRGWSTKNLQGCDTSRKQFDVTRQGDDSVNVPTWMLPCSSTPDMNGCSRKEGEFFVANWQVMEVTGPVLKYVTLSNVCSESVYDNNHGKWPDYCFYKMENEIKVVSKTLVKVTRKQLSGGTGVTTCTFEKK